jgi:hypothetical protein
MANSIAFLKFVSSVSPEFPSGNRGLWLCSLLETLKVEAITNLAADLARIVPMRSTEGV